MEHSINAESGVEAPRAIGAAECLDHVSQMVLEEEENREVFYTVQYFAKPLISTLVSGKRFAGKIQEVENR